MLQEAKKNASYKAYEMIFLKFGRVYLSKLYLYSFSMHKNQRNRDMF